MIYVVHCIDAEGPLRETSDATFERLKSIFGIELEPSAKNLERVKSGAFESGDPAIDEMIRRTFSCGNLDFLETWGAVEEMLDRLDAPSIRLALPDSEGKGWRVNWHAVAHHGFDPARNPRDRDLGVHAVFDRYMARSAAGPWGDGVHWHFHPIPRTRQANHPATAYFTDPALFEIISRRILERRWFPCVNRPGFHSERPDSHWFLEQWMPYDYANAACAQGIHQPDMPHGRYGDWRRAPADWSVYHPHHDDHQSPGACRRAIARCLYLGGRIAELTQDEVNKAFLKGREAPVVLSFCGHDFRDVTKDVERAQAMLRRAVAEFPDAAWRYEDAATAMRAVLGHGDEPHADVAWRLESEPNGARRFVATLSRPPFGPQPWLCYATRAGAVWHDNLDEGNASLEWAYTFDEQTAPIDEVSAIGLAFNTRNGRTTVLVVDPGTGASETAFHN